MKKNLLDLRKNQKAEIKELKGGLEFKKRLNTRGIREGKEIRIVAKQPRGPVVVDNGSCQFTIGRGMARKVMVEEQD